MRAPWFLCLAALFVPAAASAHPLRLTEPVLGHVEEIRTANPELREDAFSKMGGSSVASRAFLHCLATPYVDLGERQELAETIAYFHTGRRSSFNRQSEAAGVSWNLRYVLGGRPANFRNELNATHGRWALVLFGSNDAQNQNERVYLKRLVYLVEQMEQMGVVPILGSALPRRNKTRNRWIDRFNLITAAVAEHWALPYIDYNAALAELPRQGLARDGVHPNVLPPGGLRSACLFTDEGLRYGNNVRNLMTLEMLDALRRESDLNTDTDTDTDTDTGTNTDTDTDTDTGTNTNTDTVAGAGAVAGAGTGADAGAGAGADADADAGAGADAGADAAAAADTAAASNTDPVLPISVLVDKAGLPLAGDLPKGCGTPRAGARHYRVSFELPEQTRIRASAFDWTGSPPRVFLVHEDEETGPRCVRRRTQTAEVDARPGMWDLIVEVPEREADEGQMLVLVARNPR